ncbi:transcription factor CRF1-domain-containing protein [Scheffersomyces amazonensis]|uniref:transcription factor CRF1-domain-containing protein n=1 Tax=Scheffersomyces amazonensis TaxID=1078765 RepID=UPI00315C89EF
MAKSPKPSSYNKKSKAVGGAISKHSNSVGGKNFKAYKNNYYKDGYKKNRRFSIADSSSSESDKVYDNASTVYEVESISDGSESSLTAVSDEEMSNSKHQKFPSYTKKSGKNGLKGISSKKKSSKKTINWDWNQDISDGSANSDQDDDDDDDEDDEDDEDLVSSSDESDVDFIKLQAQKKVRTLQAARAMKALKSKQPNSITNSNELSDVDSELDSESEVDISDITALAQQKQSHLKKQNITNNNNNSNNNNNKAKFGRRRSDAVLPEDINFTFEFDNFGNNGNSDDESNDRDDMESNAISEVEEEKFEVQEEDIGEEIDVSMESAPTPSGPIPDKSVTEFDFDFETQLLPVPKIKEDELSSDDDYEIDDNELLATLQADNDLEEFTSYGEESKNNIKFRRSSSADSIGDDDESDPFLKEEEKFLVNEFEMNGFDDEGEGEEIGIEDYSFSDSNNRKTLLNSFKAIDPTDEKQVLQYESSLDSGSESDGEDEDEEDDDGYEDLIDFNAPFFKDSHNNNNNNNDQSKVKIRTSQNLQDTLSSKDKKDKYKHKHKTKPSEMNSDEDDDAYLWNYFFSSDNGSSDDDDGYAEEDDDLLAEEILKSMDSKTATSHRMSLTTSMNSNLRRKSVAIAPTVAQTETNYKFGIDDDYDNDSGESTDEDLSLPKSTNKNKVGSQKAKEVLSSKTADYRPPVLGTWLAVDSKPFGIIDGLSTRILQTKNIINKPIDIKNKSRRSIVATPLDGSDDSALGLDELLNVSELDNDDENDIRIWRDFNSQKKRVPLGAFRNKSILHNTLLHPEPSITTSHYPPSTTTTSAVKSSFNKHRKSSVVSSKLASVTKPSTIKKSTSGAGAGAGAGAVTTTGVVSATAPVSSTKQKRRRASIVEAVSEGFRTTKSGLFNENALLNVEEMLGDDNDLMALIKGL